MPRSLAARSLSPLVCRSVSSINRCSTSSSGIPMGIDTTPAASSVCVTASGRSETSRSRPRARLTARRDEARGPVVGIQQDQQRLVGDRLASLVHVVHRLAAQPESEASEGGCPPLGRGHLPAVRTEPDEVLHCRVAEGPPLEELPAPELR